MQKRFYPGPISNLRRSYTAFHSFDKAHTIALLEADLITPEIARAILAGLRRMEGEGIEVIRDRMGGGRHSGEAFLTETIGAEYAGWINVGRSSGDLDAMSWRFNLRRRLPALLMRLNDLRGGLLDVAGQHTTTIMPCYSIGQHAQCTSFGHMLLSWEAMFARDAQRAMALHGETGGSPTGSGIMTGSPFPISRQRTAELLGFDTVQINTRDAVVNLDTLMHAHSVIAICISNALSVANDLYLWTMTEFKYLELHDSYCSTSSIMPQKKNSWALAWIRGQASLAIGRLSGVFTLLKMESDGLEDTLMAPWQLYEAMDEVEDMLAMLHGMVTTMTVNVERLASLAGHGWTQAADIAAMIMVKGHIPWRDAHQIVAHLVREFVDAGKSPEDLLPADIDRLAEQLIGRPVSVTKEDIGNSIDPLQSLYNRGHVTGSPAPAQVAAQIDAARSRIAEDHDRGEANEAALAEAAKRLEEAVDAIIGA
ncbi:argininosuccinate lyase [Devosia faecipullorum]|uniref:argininosuccinate lyase n=1 Tax=Devosia faecipullorum TaxID=2755039 RepID=UPI00187BB724|nr:argininosuccinate lyase [Devosia faecipullorum]MBE7732825.1 argininosuccinate lyase [Devosia faecipullorum]